MPTELIARVRELHSKHQRWVPIIFFMAGFFFDTLVLRRIDELETILQQAIYLVVSGVLIGVELVEMTREVQPPAILARVWKHREAVLHFFLGTLLNSYTIFYFKSASALSSFVFIILLIALLMINEFKRFGKSQAQVHVAFFSLCVVSYLVSLAPILIGFAGIIPFLSAITGSILVLVIYYRALKPRLELNPKLLRSHVLLPFIAIQVIFAGLYFAHAIPPVPLSVSYMGIFHDIKKQRGEYQLSYTRSKWKFWQHGDQTFLARPGDTIHCFARVFSPSRFKDELQVRWLYRDERHGWLPADAIPMPIVGGREEGYRGITKKSNYTPGEWRVQIETLDGREVGRIGFNIEKDESTDPLEIKTIIQ
jgi:hypothetical protein